MLKMPAWLPCTPPSPHNGGQVSAGRRSVRFNEVRGTRGMMLTTGEREGTVTEAEKGLPMSRPRLKGPVMRSLGAGESFETRESVYIRILVYFVIYYSG